MGGCASAEADPIDDTSTASVVPVSDSLPVMREEVTTTTSSPRRTSSPTLRSRRQRRKSSKGSEGTAEFLQHRHSSLKSHEAIRRSSKGSEFSSTVAAAWTATLPQSIPNFVCAREQENPFHAPQQRTISGNLDSEVNAHYSPLWVASTIQNSLDNEDTLTHSPKLFKKLDHHRSAGSLTSDVVVVHDESEIIF